jgi:cell pole-organizing protein PopZ
LFEEEVMTPKSDHEEDMSMEEILASIRKFVTDNPTEDPHKQRVYKGDLTESVVIPPVNYALSRAPLENPPPRMAAPSSAIPTRQQEPEILNLRNPIPAGLSQDSAYEGREPTAAIQSQAYQEESIMTLTNPLGSKRPEKLGRQPAKSAHLPEHEENLVSPQAMSASANSLSRLAQATKFAPKRSFSSLADQRNVTLDQLIQDMIRPMIKQWIDTHLPSLVEEMVAKEIKRITKHQ